MLWKLQCGTPLFVSAVFILTGARAALACPYCKVTRDDLGILDTHEGNLAAASQPAPQRDFRVGLSLDVGSGYFHHGYLMQDRGLVITPAIAFSTQPIVKNDWVIEPYFVWTNVFTTEESPGYAGGHDGHSRTEQQYQQYLDEPHEGAPFPHFHSRLVDVITYEDAGGGWFETEFRPGVRLSNGPLALDLYVKGHVYPSDFHDTIIEVAGKVSYDLDTLWSDVPHPDFGLRATAIVTQELKDDNGSLDTILEATIEPIFRFDTKGRRGSVSLPLTLGMSPNGFYRDSGYDDAFFGFVSLGVEMSVPLPVPERAGKWFLNVGVTGYQMLADSAEFANQGEHGISARVGLGIAF